MARNPAWTKDELILALDLFFRVNPLHTSEQNPEIIALSNLLNTLPIHPRTLQNQQFRNPNGVYMKLCNFLRFDPTYKGKGLTAGSKLEEVVWSEFSHDITALAVVVKAIRQNAIELPPPAAGDDLDSEYEAPEGRMLTRVHMARERSPSLTKRKKFSVLNASGKLACEVCGFDFGSVYGALGSGFAECHHTLPVSQLSPGATTKLSDLAVVCANCHRMIHRSKPWLSVNELKKVLVK